MTEQDGGAAFPAYEHFIADREDSKGPVRVITGQPHGGMTLRDYFAGQALIGMLSQPASSANVLAYDDTNTAARWAYGFADAMIAEREKRQP